MEPANNSGTALSGRELFNLVALVMLAQILALFLRAALEQYLNGAGISPWLAKNLSYPIVPVVLLVLLYPYWSRQAKYLAQCFNRSDLGLRTVLIGTALGVLMRLAFWGLLVAKTGAGFATEAGAGAATRVAFSCPALLPILVYLLAMAMLAPLTEEIVFRAWLTNWLRRYGQAAAIIGSAVLFALFHPATSVFSAFWFGLFAAKLFLTAGSLWAVLIAHAVFNALIVLDWYCLNLAAMPGPLSSADVDAGVFGLVTALAAFGLSSLLVSQRVAGPRPGDRDVSG